MQNELLPIQNMIYEVRRQKVMLDSDLAKLYEIETKVLNRAVKRNIDRFPNIFMFQLTEDEYRSLRCQIGTSNERKGGRRYLPCLFRTRYLDAMNMTKQLGKSFKRSTISSKNQKSTNRLDFVFIRKVCLNEECTMNSEQ